MSAETLQRIVALHDWYCRNVMNVRRTPEIERLWLEWINAGYNGNDLRDVIRYIRKQIALNKRNEGALKLTNLFQRSEHGFVGFDMDLGLARARGNLNPMRKLEAAPDAPAAAQKTGDRSQEAEAPLRADPDALRKLRAAAGLTPDS